MMDTQWPVAQVGRGLAALLLGASLLVSSADAVIVDLVVDAGSTPVSGEQVNITAPADDPGWYRSLEPGQINSGIYLGNQWVLTATHVTGANSLPSTITLNGASFPVISGSGTTLSNPSGSFNGTALSADSDLRLFRIGVNTASGLAPEDHDANIGSDTYGVGTVRLASTTPSIGTDVVMIGGGRGRRVNTSDPNGHYHYDGISNFSGDGFEIPTPTQSPNNTKTWGANQISEDRKFQTNRVDSDNLFPVNISGRTVIAQLTQFDSDLYSYTNNTGVGTTPVDSEAQAAAGDSGGPVFFKENGEWVLGGVMHAVQTVSTVPGRAVGFGSLTLFTDLSQPHYRNQIEALLANDIDAFESVSGNSAALEGYSILGDLNLDGVVSGDGSGDPATDDIAAFAAGWKHSQQTADVYSWQLGDLNLDGETDFLDFGLMRTVTSTLIDEQSFLALLIVPEPSTAVLAGFALLPVFRRRRR